MVDLNVNHKDLNKFNNSVDPSYQRILAELQLFHKGLPGPNDFSITTTKALVADTNDIAANVKKVVAAQNGDTCHSNVIHELIWTIDNDLVDALNFLTSLNFPLRQQDLFSRHTPGTGLWFLNSDDYKTWKAGSNHFLWCQGDGKLLRQNLD